MIKDHCIYLLILSLVFLPLMLLENRCQQGDALECTGNIYSIKQE